MRELKRRTQAYPSPGGPERSGIFGKLSPALEVREGIIGSLIQDRYKLISKLGSGGFGKVYLAADQKNQALVAVKLMDGFCTNESPSGNGVFDMSEYFRFAREAKASGMISNANVVKVLDCGISNGTPFIVMEYLKGADLKTEIDRLKTIPWSRSKAIAIQACDGLKALHEQGLVHRDVKPSNLFLTLENGIEIVKLIDLGLVKFEEKGRNLEESDEIVGTPAYMAPEMLDSSLTCDHRADVFSLGATIYEMLAGQPPFKARNYLELMLMHRDSLPRPIMELNRGLDIPPGLDDIIRKALQRRPEDRFSTVDEFKSAIESLKPTSEGAESIGLLRSAYNLIASFFCPMMGLDKLSIKFSDDDLFELYKTTGRR